MQVANILFEQDVRSLDRVHGNDMDAVGVESSRLEDEFIVDMDDLDSFDPIIAFTTVMIESK